MVQESSFGARLRALMEERGWSYEQLGAELGMNPQTLNRYVLGQREPKIGTATAMAMALEVDPLWLQGYDVPRRRASGAPGTPGRGAVVPILGVIRAGAPILAVEDIEGYAAAGVPDPEQHFYLRVTGDSMVNAGIQSGDLVLIRRQDAAESGQIVACLLDGADATLKRLRIQRDIAVLQPENPAYEPRIIPLKDFETGAARIVGVAVKLVRNL
ncbi:LexA repressor 1 [Oscillospiraceae bacterium]|nr:LexA repressor 1 [Oscillospiraceae bacterium]BDF74150.1 LexA repressor 1 [Oscillospiraceae bacterium]